MINKIKTYFLMKKLSRQMKYELLSKAYLIVSETDNYFELFSKLAAEASVTEPKELMDKFINAIAKLTHETATKDADLEIGME